MPRVSAFRPEPRAKRYVDDLFPDLSTLFQAADAVRELRDQPGWKYVTAGMGAELRSVDSQLEGGTEPLSQAQYAMLHGQRRGLRFADEMADAIVAVADRRYEEQKAKHEGVAEPMPGEDG